MIMLRELLPYGYKAYTGKILVDKQVDAYNMIQEEINSRLRIGLSIHDDMLNRSHRFFVTISE